MMLLRSNLLISIARSSLLIRKPSWVDAHEVQTTTIMKNDKIENENPTDAGVKIIDILKFIHLISYGKKS